MKIKLIIALLLSQLGFSQQKICGTDAYMQQKMSDPVAKQRYLDLQNKFEIELAKIENQQNKSPTNTNATLLIPVAVHFPSVATNSTDKTCLMQLAQTQIDVLNADFNATNSDAALWTPSVSALYPGTNVGNLNIQFVIATQNHPAGTGLANGQKAVTFGTNFLAGADKDTQWNYYLNFVVRNAGLLGYTFFPGDPKNGESVVLNYDAFGTGAGCTGYVPGGFAYLGRTATHEVGHYFNLIHIFGTNNICDAANTDNVADTPPCIGSAGTSCPAIGSVAGCVAGEKSLTMNYMNYTNDVCKFMFTAGQVTRMRAYYDTTLYNQFATNVLASENFEFTNFKLYPNPNLGTFKISFTPENNDEVKISIFDYSGRNIYNKSYQNTILFDQELQLDTIASGVYFINIQNGANKMVKKIIVE